MNNLRLLFCSLIVLIWFTLTVLPLLFATTNSFQLAQEHNRQFSGIKTRYFYSTVDLEQRKCDLFLSLKNKLLQNFFLLNETLRAHASRGLIGPFQV